MKKQAERHRRRKRMEAVEGRRSRVRRGKRTVGETPGALWATTAAGPSHLALVSASPTPAQSLQFKGHHRGGSCPYPHLIWPDPGLAAKLSLSCQHSQEQLYRQLEYQPSPFYSLFLRPLEVTMEPQCPWVSGNHQLQNRPDEAC